MLCCSMFSNVTMTKCCAKSTSYGGGLRTQKVSIMMCLISPSPRACSETRVRVCMQVRGDHAIEGPLEFHSWKGARSDLVAPHEGEGGQHN